MKHLFFNAIALLLFWDVCDEPFIVPRPGWVKTLAFRRWLQHVMVLVWERVIGNQATAYLA